MNKPRVVSAPDWTLRLLPELLAEFNVEPISVLHVGAYHGEEVPIYLESGFQRIGLVEPDPDSYAYMKNQPWAKDPKIAMFPVACDPSYMGGVRELLLTDGGAWNSLKPSTSHPPLSRIWVGVVAISDLQYQIQPNVLVVDTQGTEMQALSTAELRVLDMIIVETQAEGLDGANPAELADFANRHDWRPVVVLDRSGGWTDTVLVPNQ